MIVKASLKTRPWNHKKQKKYKLWGQLFLCAITSKTGIFDVSTSQAYLYKKQFGLCDTPGFFKKLNWNVKKKSYLSNRTVSIMAKALCFAEIFLKQNVTYTLLKQNYKINFCGNEYTTENTAIKSSLFSQHSKFAFASAVGKCQGFCWGISLFFSICLSKKKCWGN